MALIRSQTGREIKVDDYMSLNQDINMMINEENPTTYREPTKHMK